MNGRNASLFSSLTSRSTGGARRRGSRTSSGALLFAASLLASLWAMPACDAQIEANAYISSIGSNTVTVFDTETSTPVGTPITVGNGPFGVASTPDGRFVYVANVTAGTVSVIDPATNSVVATVSVGTSPWGVAVSPDAKFAYVANHGSNNVSVISTATNTVVATVPVGLGPFGVAVTPNGQSAFVVNNGSNNVSVINTGTNTVVSVPVTVGNQPQGVAVSPNGQFAYVTNLTNSTLSVINTTTLAVVATVPLAGAGTDAVTPDGNFVYVTNQTASTSSSTVSKISTTTNMVVATTPVESMPFGVAITPDGKFAYVANSTSGDVSVINTSTNSPVGTLVVATPSVFGSFIGPNIIVAQAAPLQIASDLALTPLGFGTFVDFNGGTLQITGSSFSTARTISLLALGGTIDTNGFDSLFSGTLVNSGSLTKTGVGTLTLSGDNSYSGGTNISGGTLSVSSDSNLGTGNISISNSAELLTTATGFSSAKLIALGAGGGTLASVTGGTATYGGVISGTGPLSIGDEINQGTIVLNAANTYTGGTSINRGTLQVGADVNLGDASGALIFNGGTLNTVASFTTARAITLNGPGGIFVPDAATTFTEIGVITGVGGLTQTGAGTVILQGNNDYTGGTTVLAGTLQAGSATAFVNNTAYTVNGGTLDLNNFNLLMTSLNGTGGTVNLGAAALTINNTGADVYSGNIQGTGSLTKIGAGTQTLSGTNRYTGGTTVLAGTLQAGSATAFVNNTAYTVNGGTLDLNNFNLTMSSLNGVGGTVHLGSAALTINNTGADLFSGNIQGTGSLTKIGAGTQTLSGANSYTGGTTLLAGTLQAGSATAFVNNTAYTVNGGTLDLNNFKLTMSSLNGTGGTVNLGSAALTINATATDLYSGNIQGNGSLTKIGAGTLILSANNAYSGGTTLNSGTLVVNSSQAVGLGDVVVNGGVLRTNLQPINVKGNYTQNAGGALQLSLRGSASGQYDVLNVGGRAALDGTLQLLALNGYQPKFGDQLTLVLAAGGVSGQFATVLDPFGSLFSLELVYTPNSALLEFAANFVGFALTFNEGGVAAELDKVASDPREAQLISFLRSEPLGNLPADFDRISPDSLSALYEISFSAANVQASNLENRFAEIRNGSTGFSSSLNITNSPGAMVEDSNGKAVIEPGKNVLSPSAENNWGVWISGTGQFVNVSGDGNGKGYDFATGGVSFGLDYRLTKNFAVGVAIGYAHNWTNLTGDGNIDVNSGRGGLYAAFSQSGFYLNGYVGGAYNSYDTQRDALGGGASGSTNGGEFDGYAGGGYEFHWGGFTFGPIASLEYSNVDVSAYNETGSLAPLRIVSQHQNSLRTNVGLSTSYTVKAGKVQLRPSLRASWQHEYSYGALPIDSQFASGAGGIFTVNGPAEGHDSALIDAGVDVQWTPTIGTYFGYNGNVGRSNYDSHSLICSVHWDF